MLTQDVLLRLCRARDHLREIDDAPASIREVAQQAGMSPYHFIRRFEALFGVTPHQYRIDARLERAKRLLASDTRSITEVCLEVGCASLGSFSLHFARRVGLAPSAYRRQVAESGEPPRPGASGCFSLMAGADGMAILEKRARAAASDTHAPPQREQP